MPVEIKCNGMDIGESLTISFGTSEKGYSIQTISFPSEDVAREFAAEVARVLGMELVPKFQTMTIKHEPMDPEVEKRLDKQLAKLRRSLSDALRECGGRHR